MNVFDITFDWDYRTFEPVLDEQVRSDMEDQFGWGKSLLSGWSCHDIKALTAKPPPHFFTTFSRAVIGVTPKALELQRIKDELMRCGELLPVIYEGETFWLFNCLNVVNALDAGQSEIVVGNNGHRYAREMVFKKELVIPEWLFCVPESRANTFATQRFVDFYQEHQMTGLIFTPQKIAS